MEEGLATPAEWTKLVRSSFGFRLPFYGPFQIADMAGLDVYIQYFRCAFCRFGRWLGGAGIAAGYRSCRAIMAHERWPALYEYSDDERAALLLERDKRYAALMQLAGGFPDQAVRARRLSQCGIFGAWP